MATDSPRRHDRPTAGEVASDFLARHVDAVQRHDPGVRRDTDDAVHQMRVSARRLRSGLSSFRRVLDREATAHPRQELRWLAQQLSDARDLEVQHELLLSRLDEVADQPGPGTDVTSHLHACVGRWREQARHQVMAALTSDRYADLHTSLQGLVDDPPLTPRAGGPAARELRHAVRRAHRRLDAAVARVGTGHVTDEDLHDVRKKAKQARYTVEAAGVAFGDKVRRWGKGAKRLQSVLGEHQDAHVTREMLHALATDAAPNQRLLRIYMMLAQRTGPEPELMRDEVVRRWEAMEQRRPRWLA